MSLVSGLYLSFLSVISLFGLHKMLLVWRFYKHKSTNPKPMKTFSEGELPKVTVQLPIFNEMYVAERLLDAVSKLSYPPSKLEIQVLDDSTDETQEICQVKVANLKRQHINISYIRRDKRQGFKAGALAHGLKFASGELVMIFDADFIPPPKILLNMVDYFSDSNVAMVQSRWGHVNRQYSGLTKIQALMLDGHFMIEQVARHRSGCFFNFNGTAGIWRVSAIEDAGGWQHTTVTEDLDLSYRAQLKGWQCVYLPNVIVPAELPMEMNSFKSQQFRWAKGASQVARKLWIPILCSPLPLHIKMEALLHMANNFNYVLLLCLLLLSLPYQIFIDQYYGEVGLFIYLLIFLITSLNLICFYSVSQYEQKLIKSPWQLGWDLLLLMSIGIGLSINQSLAVCDGLLRTGTDFVRTPKHGVISNAEHWRTKRYRSSKSWVIYLEILMFAYLLVTLGFAVRHAHYLSLPFLTLFCFGYLYVPLMSLYQNRTLRGQQERKPLTSY